jgi:Peptidase family S41
MKSISGLIAEQGGDPTKVFTVVEQARGRVMTDLLMSGDKTSSESLATEKNLARLRLQLTEAHSNKDIEKLRDEIFIAEQFRSVSPEVSILKTREHQAINIRQMAAQFGKDTKLATLVGEKTMGNVLGSTTFTVGRGYTLYMPVVGWYSPNGSYTEGSGVQPDVFVDIDPEALARGSDAQLKKAFDVFEHCR